MRIPSGGTLVVGREQDCVGGCFDSAPEAAGDVQQRYQLEYGAQDFTGVIDELRIWKTVRSQDQIRQVTCILATAHNSLIENVHSRCAPYILVCIIRV